MALIPVRNYCGRNAAAQKRTVPVSVEYWTFKRRLGSRNHPISELSVIPRFETS